MKGSILRTDSYKITHWAQDPPDVTGKYAYLESRGGMFKETVFFGLQPYLKKYLAGRIVDNEELMESTELFNEHFQRPDAYNLGGWKHILSDHDAKWPVEIRAVPEGTIVPIHNVLLSIQNTCPKCAWVGPYLETLLMKVWYPTTVATLSYHMRKLILGFLERSGTPGLIDYIVQDFGYRGVSSEESAT